MRAPMWLRCRKVKLGNLPAETRVVCVPVVGTVKDTIGSLTGNDSQQAKGKAQEVREFSTSDVVLLQMCSTACKSIAVVLRPVTEVAPVGKLQQ